MSAIFVVIIDGISACQIQFCWSDSSSNSSQNSGGCIAPKPSDKCLLFMPFTFSASGPHCALQHGGHVFAITQMPIHHAPQRPLCHPASRQLMPGRSYPLFYRINGLLARCCSGFHQQPRALCVLIKARHQIIVGHSRDGHNATYPSPQQDGHAQGVPIYGSSIERCCQCAWVMHVNHRDQS